MTGTQATRQGGSRWARATAALALASALVPTAGTRAAEGAAGPIDLVGTWYVVIHYRDDATANPDSDRWEDHVWVFERKGTRLQWTDYPIVVFADGTGRFESRAGNPRARTLTAWMPNEAQMLEIQQGPHVNPRGSKSKSLKGSDASGYETVGGLRAQGAMMIGYHEDWSIQKPASLPVFTRTDVMGTGRSGKAGGEDQSLEGVTRFTTVEIADAGTLHGSYERDENRRGTFVMMRAGAIRDLESDGRTPNEKAFDRAREQMDAGVKQHIDELMKRIEAGDDEARRELQELREDWQKQRTRER